ncbi:MAG: dihydroorotase [Clostridia bacterium]|nr:dihydroorotase [Clostridia bacterium]
MADKLLKNATVYSGGKLFVGDILVSDGLIAAVGCSLESKDAEIFDMTGLHIFPGFTDVHVHLREPGFSYKETVASGTASAARGGYTAVCAMPNLNPVPDCKENLDVQLELIRKNALVRVLPYGAITVGEKGKTLADMEAMADHVVAFSDDGKGVDDDGLMEEAFIKAKSLGKMICAHCEVSALAHGAIHDGAYAAAHGIPGIPSEAEWKMIERDISLVRKIGVPYHVCHVSCKESVELIRAAQKEGLDVTGETGPHYLVFSENDLVDSGSFRMNPPIRTEEDRLALIDAVADGTLGMIATDHAPHSAEEKSKGLAGSLNGIVGLETAFPVLWTKFVETGIISAEKLLARFTDGPRDRFNFGAEIAVGKAADYTVFDMNEEYTVDSREFESMGKSSPFEGMKVKGRCVETVVGGKTVWKYAK